MLSEELTQLENAELVRLLREEELAYFFKHAMTQQTAYDSLLIKKRRAIHHRVAQINEQLYADRLDEYAALLSYHYAEAGDDAKTVEYALQAAALDMHVYAYPEARGHFVRALDASKRLPDTQENRRRRAEASLNYVEAAWGALAPQELYRILSEAELLAQTLNNSDSVPGDTRLLLQIHSALVGVHFARGEYKEALHYARLGLNEASVVGDNQSEGQLSCLHGMALSGQGHFADAAPYFMHASAILEKTPERWEWYNALLGLAMSLAMRGQVSAGLYEGERALTQTETTHNQFGITQCRTLLLPVYLQRGDMAQLLEQSEQAITVAAQAVMPVYESFALAFKALAQSRLGQHQAAQQSMALARSVGAKLGGRFFLFDWIDAADAEIALSSGNTQEAIALADATIITAQAVGGIFAEGWAERVKANALAASIPPQWEQAQLHFAASLELLEATGAVLEIARTQDAWGQMLQAQGNAEAAQQHFDQAAQINLSSAPSLI